MFPALSFGLVALLDASPFVVELSGEFSDELGFSKDPSLVFPFSVFIPFRGGVITWAAICLVLVLCSTTGS